MLFLVEIVYRIIPGQIYVFVIYSAFRYRADTDVIHIVVIYARIYISIDIALVFNVYHLLNIPKTVLAKKYHSCAKKSDYSILALFF